MHTIPCSEKLRRASLVRVSPDQYTGKRSTIADWLAHRVYRVKPKYPGHGPLLYTRSEDVFTACECHPYLSSDNDEFFFKLDEDTKRIFLYLMSQVLKSGVDNSEEDRTIPL